MNRGLSRLALIAAAIVLAGCGGPQAPAAVYHGDDVLPNGMTVKQQIEARQHNLKDLGGAAKVVNDQVKAETPQLEEIRLAAQEVRSHAHEITNWFPKGTGPDAGVNTAALPIIWSDEAGFKAAAARLAAAADVLADTATADDVAAIAARAQDLGAACKNCHDTYRGKKD